MERRERDERVIETKEAETGEREHVRRGKIIKYNFLISEIVMFNRSVLSTTFLQQIIGDKLLLVLI